MIEQIKSRYQNKLNKYNSDLGQKQLLEKQLEDKNEYLKEIKYKIELYKQCTLFLQHCLELIRDKIKADIEGVATHALKEIMHKDYSFHIQFEILRNMPEAQFLVGEIVDGEELLFDPVEDKGNGICDITSIALRIILLELYKPKIGGPLLLDETAAKVSPGYKDKVGKFLSEISRELKRQIIFVTNEMRFLNYADKTFRINVEKGKRSVKVINE